jgi:hypothetical protein
MKRLAVLLGAGALACGQGAPDLLTADAAALLEAPPGVQCIRVIAAGATRTAVRNLPVGAGGAAQRLVLSDLPTGRVLFSATAHDGPCGGIASWIAEDIVQDLAPGAEASFTLVFHPNGGLLLTAAFEGAGTLPADATCLTVAVEGALRSAEQRIPLSPASALQWSLERLPTGNVLLAVDAWAEPCGSTSTRTWSAPAQLLTLAAGQSVAASVTLARE